MGTGGGDMDTTHVSPTPCSSHHITHQKREGDIGKVGLHLPGCSCELQASS